MATISSRMQRTGGLTFGRAEPLMLQSPVQVIAATLSAAAGVIHLVMVPSHMGQTVLEGTGFALAGWFQIAFALLVLARSGRLLLQLAVVGNVVLLGLWAASRTSGLPFGPNAGHAESATFVDLTAVGLEVGLIAIAALMLARPSFGGAWTGAGRLLAVALPIAVLALTTAALGSPSARDHASHSHGHAHGDDKGLSFLTNGHHHEIVEVELHPTTQAILDEQLDVTREVARLYPMVADAEAAGYRRAGPYSPGLGAHYIKYSAAAMNVDGVVDDADLREPLAIIYDGTDAESKVAGFMYYSMSATEPEGFVGPNDVWHYHENICLKAGPNGQIDAPLGADNQATAAQCQAVGGNLVPVTQWMVHVWSVPGYDNVEGGVFAEVNPALACADGTYYLLPIEEWAANPLNVCRSQVP